MKELILTNTNKVIRDAFIEDDAIYFHYKPILSNAKYRDGDHVTLQSKSAYQLSRVFYRLAKEILYSSITRIRT